MRHTYSWLAAVLTALSLCLLTRSQVFTRVVVEGHTIRMLVAGSGAPTVVFENGYPAPLEEWARVQPTVSTFARTVTYDRAGIGLSDPGASPRDGRRIAGELREALRQAGLAPPFILVGHSLGGLYARAFAGAYPGEVAGLVLVDPTTEAEALAASSRAPEPRALPATVAQLRASSLPRVPVSLIVAMGPSDVPFMTSKMRASGAERHSERVADSVANADWLRAVPDGRLIVTRASGHNVPQEAPELVVHVIREMVESVRVDLRKRQ